MFREIRWGFGLFSPPHSYRIKAFGSDVEDREGKPRGKWIALEIFYKATYFRIYLRADDGDEECGLMATFLEFYDCISKHIGATNCVVVTCTDDEYFVPERQPTLPPQIFGCFCWVFDRLLDTLDDLFGPINNPVTLHDRYVCPSHEMTVRIKGNKFNDEGWHKAPDDQAPYEYGRFMGVGSEMRRPNNGRFPFVQPRDVKIVDDDDDPLHALRSKVTFVLHQSRLSGTWTCATTRPAWPIRRLTRTTGCATRASATGRT